MPRLPELARAWRRQRGAVLLREGGGRLLCWGTAALTIALWADEMLLLPGATRAGLWLAGVAAGLAGAHILLLRPWRRSGMGLILDEVAREFPRLKPFLRPAWELRDTAGAHTSPRLAQAHQEATEALLAELPARPLFVWRPSRPLVLAAVAAGLGAGSWLGLGSTSWERILAPWRDVPLERFLAVQPGDAFCELGQPAVISVRRAGPAGGPRQALETRLWLRTTGPWRQVPWERPLPDGAAFTVAAVAEPLYYRVTWRSLASREYRLLPRSEPRLDDLRARSSGVPGEVSLNGAEPLVARRGTYVVVRGRPNQLVSRVVLRASFLPVPTVMRCLPGGDCEAGFFAQQDGTFQFDLETPEGRRDPAPVVYGLRAVPDEPPQAELLSPIQPVQASPQSVVPVAYSVKDDSGLTRTALLVRVPGEREKEVPLQRFLQRARKEFIGDYSWELAGLPVGAKVEFQIKACDDAAASQCGVSEKGLIEIVDFEAGHRVVGERWEKTQELLGRLAGREERLRDLHAAGDAAAARQELAGLPEAWKESTASMSELARQMQADAYANPGLSRQFDDLARDLQRAESQDLPAALAASRQGDPASAQKKHGRLAQELRRAERLLEKAKPMQGLQDFYHQAGRMGQDGEQISADLEAMAGGESGQEAAEALQRVRSALKRLQERMSSLQKSIEALPRAEPSGGEAKARRGYTMPLLQAQTSADALQQALRAGDFRLAAEIAKEMASQLAAIEAAMTAAAAAGAASRPESRASARLERLQSLWGEVVEAQSRLVEKSQGLEEARRELFVQAQKDLLSRLAAEEEVLISSAGAQFPGEALAVMRSVREEFASGRVTRAPELLRSLSAGLREAAAQPASGERPEALLWFASAHDDIARRLGEAPAAPPPGSPGPETASASRRQAEVRGQTADLQRELEAVSTETGAVPPAAAEGVEAAQGEQRAAEGDLDRGDSASALGHQEKALALLEQGGKNMAGAAAGQKSVEIGISGGFEGPGGGVRRSPGDGSGGARLEFVPLPSAKDYRPPKEIREELERSLKEGRPPAYDGVIKEYFKRLSQ